jgi:hypothetical protein
MAAPVLDDDLPTDTASVLATAFDLAWERLRVSGSYSAEEPYRERARDALARHLVFLLKQGERDPARLAEAGIAYLSRLRLRPES